MTGQATISVSGGLTDSIRTLVSEFPGATINRMGRALIRMGLRQALGNAEALVEELRQLDAPWPTVREEPSPPAPGVRGSPRLGRPRLTRTGERA